MFHHTFMLAALLASLTGLNAASYSLNPDPTINVRTTPPCSCPAGPTITQTAACNCPTASGGVATVTKSPVNPCNCPVQSITTTTVPLICPCPQPIRFTTVQPACACPAVTTMTTTHIINGNAQGPQKRAPDADVDGEDLNDIAIRVPADAIPTPTPIYVPPPMGRSHSTTHTNWITVQPICECPLMVAHTTTKQPTCNCPVIPVAKITSTKTVAFPGCNCPGPTTISKTASTCNCNVFSTQVITVDQTGVCTCPSQMVMKTVSLTLFGHG